MKRKTMTLFRMTTETCRICHARTAAPRFTAREMMFGSREAFDYFQCTGCACLQIAEIPEDLERHYPPGYYSFGGAAGNGGLAGLMYGRRRAWAFGRIGPIGAVASLRRPYAFAGIGRWLKRAGAGPRSRVLDVGCGAGQLLHDMAAMGFENLVGADPFLAGDSEHANGVRLVKRSVGEIESEFDLVMLHHALEHVPDQHESMAAVSRLLAPNAVCLVRVPISSSYAWQRYGEYWVQLDPPRHLYLHSERSLQILGEAAGLVLEHVEHDSTAFQFVGSELYRRGIPLSEGTGVRLPLRDRLTYRWRAGRLNRARRGDQAVFFFRKPARPEAPAAT